MEPLCIHHYVKRYYILNKGCLEVYLDPLIDKANSREKLNVKDKALVKEIKKILPGIKNEFPVLFEKPFI
ncbi:MAG: hypothetical protein AABW90_03385 [Nanoarchaeota archaeon]